MTTPKAVLIALLLTGLGAAWGCDGGGGGETETAGAPPANKAARSKAADPALTAAASRGPAKAGAERKPGRNAVLKAFDAAGEITAGSTVQGTLQRGDRVLDSDGSYVDYHAYRGRRGERLVITLESSDFDAYLLLGLGPVSALDIIAEDDDGGGGLNSRIEITLPEDGRYTILANSLGEGETGRYTLRIESGGSSTTGGPGSGGGVGVAAIARNSTVQGRLETSDPTLEDDSHFDTWIFEGRAGERMTATLTSNDFDTYLLLAVGTPGDMEIIDENDDSGDSTNSRLEVTLPETGVYTLLANSYEVDTGAYSLRLDIADGPSRTQYPGGGDPNGRYALLVGIDDYPGNDSDLASPVADARLMRTLLVDKFGYDPANVVMLLDEEGNREQIISAFQGHLGQAGPNGSALFYYSGHGFQLDDNIGIGAPDDPETGDGKDEALYVWGYGERSTMLLDDELGNLIDGLSTDRTMIILDSCSSGSGSRGAGVPKSVSVNPADINNVLEHLYVPRKFIGAYKEGPVVQGELSGLLDASDRQRSHVLLAGSTDADFSYVATRWPDRGGVASVFTYYLIEALESAPSSATFRSLMAQVRDRTTAYTKAQDYDPPQIPQVGGELATSNVAAFFAAGRRVRSGLDAFESGNFADAADALVPEAEGAGPEAWMALASMYSTGRGVAQDAARALYFAQRASSAAPDSVEASQLVSQLESQVTAARAVSVGYWGSRQETRLDPSRFVCLNWSGEPTTSHAVYKFRANASIQQMASDIVYYSGLTQNFAVQEANVGNAGAEIRGTRRWIVFDPSFLMQLNDKSGTPWAAYSVMAHEIGHHLQGHTLDSGGSRPPTELEADEFSGFILARMGATREEAQVAMQTFGSPSGSNTHPPRDQRLQAISTGWDRGRSLGAVREGGQPLPPVNTAPSPRRPQQDRVPPNPWPGPGGQIASVCMTQVGPCPMMVPIPVGAPCYCQVPGGIVPGSAR